MKAKRLLVIGFIAVISMAFCQSAFAKERIVFGGAQNFKGSLQNKGKCLLHHELNGFKAGLL